MSCNLDREVLKEARRQDDQIVWIRQSLTEYVQKEIQHHLDTSGEGITAFCHRIGMQSQRVKGFLAGVTSLQLNTADRILKAIDEWKEDE